MQESCDTLSPCFFSCYQKGKSRWIINKVGTTFNIFNLLDGRFEMQANGTKPQFLVVFFLFHNKYHFIDGPHCCRLRDVSFI